MGDESEALLTAFLLGLSGAGHCVGMCGGIVAALASAMPADGSGTRRGVKRASMLLGYNLGRIMSYTLAGVLAGWFGWMLAGNAALSTGLRIAAGVLLIAMGCYLAGWWRVLVKLERVGQLLWRNIEPLGQRFLPVRHAGHALLLGMVWGWLPCGLVYSALLFAATRADWLGAANVMLFFGLGTLPAMLLGGVMAGQLQTLLRKRGVQVLLGVSVIVYGCWTIGAVVWHGTQHQHHGSEHNMQHGMQHNNL